MSKRILMSVLIGLGMVTSSPLHAEVRTGLSYEEAQTAPEQEIIDRVFAQFADSIVEIARPRPDDFDNLELGTRPTAAVPGICEAQIVKVLFASEAKAPGAFTMGRMKSLSLSTVFKISGSTSGPFSSSEDYQKALDLTNERCVTERPIDGFYFSAPSSTFARVAALTIQSFSGSNTLARLPAMCGNEACDETAIKSLATASTRDILNVASQTCPDSNDFTLLCFKVDLLVGERRPSASGYADIVERDGWSLTVQVKDPMRHTDVTSFNEIIVQKISANPATISGPAASIP